MDKTRFLYCWSTVTLLWRALHIWGNEVKICRQICANYLSIPAISVVSARLVGTLNITRRLIDWLTGFCKLVVIDWLWLIDDLICCDNFVVIYWFWLIDDWLAVIILLWLICCWFIGCNWFVIDWWSASDEETVLLYWKTGKFIPTVHWCTLYSFFCKIPYYNIVNQSCRNPGMLATGQMQHLKTMIICWLFIYLQKMFLFNTAGTYRFIYNFFISGANVG